MLTRKISYFLKATLTATFFFVSVDIFSQQVKEQLNQADTVAYRLRKKKINQFDFLAGSGLSKNSGTFEDFMFPKFVYSFGIGMSHTFSKLFYVHTRAMWELKGSKVKTSGFEIDTNNSGSVYNLYYNTNFRYFTLSLQPTFKIGHKKNISFGGGGYYSFLEKAIIKVRKINQMTNVETRYEVKDQRNFEVKYDAGISVFAGYSLPINNKSSCSIHIICNKGVVSLFDGLTGYQRNNTIMLLLSYNIRR